MRPDEKDDDAANMADTPFFPPHLTSPPLLTLTRTYNLLLFITPLKPSFVLKSSLQILCRIHTRDPNPHYNSQPTALQTIFPRTALAPSTLFFFLLYSTLFSFSLPLFHSSHSLILSRPSQPPLFQVYIDRDPDQGSTRLHRTTLGFLATYFTPPFQSSSLQPLFAHPYSYSRYNTLHGITADI